MHKLLTKNHIKTFGNSMYPLLHDGDVVCFEEIPFSKIQINDIIVAQAQGKFLTHRVIYKTENHLILKGDNNINADSRIKKKDIVGKLSHVLRKKEKVDPEHLYLIQSSLYIREINKVIELFEEKNLDHIFLKGLPVHLYYQKKAPRRVYADCDILIHKKDLEFFSKLISQLGYKTVNKDFLGENNSSLKEISFYKNVNLFRIVFDVHIEPVFLMNKLDNNYMYSDELLHTMTGLFFSKSITRKVSGKHIRMLSGIYLTLYLALHFFHHNFKDNFRLELIDNIIRIESKKEKRFWKNLEGQILFFNVAQFVYPVFLILRKYYFTPIPQDFLRNIQPKSFFAKEIAKRAVSDSIFNSQNRFHSGIQRFLLIFTLSTTPWYLKIYYLINPKLLLLVLKSIKIYLNLMLLSVRKVFILI